jgi:hypothetical protein
VQLVTTCGDDQVRALDALARAADATTRDDSAVVSVGRLRAGTSLQLRFLPDGATT